MSRPAVRTAQAAAGRRRLHARLSGCYRQSPVRPRSGAAGTVRRSRFVPAARR
ncbi:hypothetical protein HSR122_2393 [Halapricum desulfuricans]|uniref:Uncharacterized protein n=1 Tax=Halapricum desulfuricans TaxID=2841257 RepID=A0A897N5U5_9EURY|nr:hypothetical protein HSR122_2393 [Halapricum desulfuricans]